MKVLQRIYMNRPDLQEVYPEAEKGEIGRLASWAAGVAQKRWKDASYEILKPHAAAFQEMRIPPEAVALPWNTAKVTSHLCRNPLAMALRVMQQADSSDISNHLMTLSLLITEFDLRQIVELGTRNGNSTLVLLEAARAIGGQVTSVDIEPCLLARQRVKDAGLSDWWTFLEGDDLQFGPPQIPSSIDLLFVDTSHIYAPTMAELKKYSAYLKKGSWIALHDYVSFPGVSRAIHDYALSTSLFLRFYPFMHQNGLALLRVIGANDASGVDCGPVDSTPQ